MSTFRFPPTARIKKKKQFLEVQTASRAGGPKAYGRAFLVLAIKNQLNASRLGITVTTKIDKRACVRNLIKRRVREVYRRVYTKFLYSADLVVIARSDVLRQEFAAIERELLESFRRLGLIAGERGQN